MINNFWKEKWMEVENLRFSTHQKEFFKLIQRFTKYQQLERRDGSILNVFKDE